jgi:hypothetical protein
MIVGRNPRNPVIGDTALLRADNRRGVGTIVDTVLASPRRVGHPSTRFRTAMAMTFLREACK